MKNQCQSPGDYCGSDSSKLAGTVPPCPVCAPHMSTFRELRGWNQGAPGRFPKRKASTPAKGRAGEPSQASELEV